MAHKLSFARLEPPDPDTPLDAAPDEVLLALIARHEQDALAALYDRYGGRVFALALRLLDQRQVAEEITQDVFLRIWQRAELYQPGSSSFLAWLLAITRNRSIDELRSRQAAARRREAPAAPLTLISEADDPQRRAEARLLGDEVRRVLADLPGQQRRAVELAVFGGLTHSEIAAALDTPLGTVKSWLRMGLRRLREGLGPGWPAIDQHSATRSLP